MNFKTSFIHLAILLFFVLIACGLAQTSTSSPDGGDAPQTAAALNQSGEVTAQTLVNLNLRQGPGTHYPAIGNLPANSEVTVIGRLADGSWLQVKTGQGEGWVSGQADFVKVEAAALADLPVVEAPPPAFDISNPMVNRMLNEIPLVVHNQGSYICASHGGLNHLLPEVRSGHIIGPHAGDFVYNGNNVLFEYANGAFQLIREDPIARFDGGVKYLSFAQAMQLFADGQIIWTGTLGQWPGRGVTGCDPAAKS
jgi:hypothetical protein